VLEVLYQHAKFRGARISPAAGQPKTLSFYRQHCSQRNAPVFNLLRGRFWGFSPHRGDTLHRRGWNSAWRMPNVTAIGATIRVQDPQNWNCYWDLIKMWNISTYPLRDFHEFCRIC